MRGRAASTMARASSSVVSPDTPSWWPLPDVVPPIDGWKVATLYRAARVADPNFALSKAEAGHPVWGPVYLKSRQ